MPAIESTDTGLQARTKINTAIAVTEALLKQNYAATVAPTFTDDSAAGYSVGSTWLIPTTGEMWRARSVTAGAARWVKVDTADFDAFVNGNHYLPFATNALGNGSSITAGSLRLFYGVVKQRVTIDALSARVTTAGTNIQLSVYASISGRPRGVPVAKTASLSAAVAAFVTGAIDGGNTVLEPGPYWFGIVGDTAVTCISFATGGSAAPSVVGSTNGIEILSASPLQGLSTPATLGSLPDLTSATFTAITNPTVAAIAFRPVAGA